jgi:hypothetical protein
MTYKLLSVVGGGFFQSLEKGLPYQFSELLESHLVFLKTKIYKIMNIYKLFTI